MTASVLDTGENCVVITFGLICLGGIHVSIIFHFFSLALQNQAVL